MIEYDKSKIVFIDTETIGGHEVWEIAVIWWHVVKGEWIESIWTIDLIHLNIIDQSGSLHHPNTKQPLRWLDVAFELARILNGKHLIGAISSFDAYPLNHFLRKNTQVPTWHYHIIDIEAMCVGWIAHEYMHAETSASLPLPWKGDWMLEQIGIPVGAQKHTAIDDARRVKRAWERMMGR